MKLPPVKTKLPPVISFLPPVISHLPPVISRLSLCRAHLLLVYRASNPVFSRQLPQICAPIDREDVAGKRSFPARMVCTRPISDICGICRHFVKNGNQRRGASVIAASDEIMHPLLHRAHVATTLRDHGKRGRRTMLALQAPARFGQKRPCRQSNVRSNMHRQAIPEECRLFSRVRRQCSPTRPIRLSRRIAVLCSIANLCLPALACLLCLVSRFSRALSGCI